MAELNIGFIVGGKEVHTSLISLSSDQLQKIKSKIQRYNWKQFGLILK
jgi:hypothetical protein